MSTIKLFQINNNKVSELEGRSVTIEKSLQAMIEKHLEEFLGVTFLQSEYSTGEKHAGRIDTLGIDENNCPVIIEYKRSMHENVINQGLYYLDWLLDHKAEYQLLVMKKKGNKKIEDIEWDNARLICIAGDFTKFDTYAIQQINRNIELIRYKQFEDILLLDLVNIKTEQKNGKGKKKKSNKVITRPTVADYLVKCSDDLKKRYDTLKQYIISLGDDVQLKELERYFAFRRIKNFVSMKFQPKTNTIVMWLTLNPKSIKTEKGFTKDVSKIGHHGTGDLEVRINDDTDLEKSKYLILKSYEIS